MANKPKAGELLHERRNGHFLLQVTGHPSYGLPFGQDRLVPLRCWIHLVGNKAERNITVLSRHFSEFFGATIFFGTEVQRNKAAVVHQARFNFMSEAQRVRSRFPPPDGVSEV